MSRRGRKTNLGAKRRTAHTRAARRPFENIVPPTFERASKVDHYDFPVDRELAKGRITEEEHRAAQEYRRLRIVVHGYPHTKAASLYARAAGEEPGRGHEGIPDEKKLEREFKTEYRYSEARKALLAHRRRLLDVVDNVVIYLRPPTDDQREWLVEGLAILADKFRYRRNKAA